MTQVLDEIVKANTEYSRTFDLGDLPMPPSRKLAVLVCMDARIHVEEVLGLEAGDAHIIRNAGGIATTDAIRSLIISHYLLGTQEFAVINHTDCGMLTFHDDELHERLKRETGRNSLEPGLFYSFRDPVENVRSQVQALHSHPWIPKQVPIRGFVYDVKTGKLNEVNCLVGSPI